MFYKHMTIPYYRLYDYVVYIYTRRYIVISSNQIVVTLENDDRGARGLYNIIFYPHKDCVLGRYYCTTFREVMTTVRHNVYII